MIVRLDEKINDTTQQLKWMTTGLCNNMDKSLKCYAEWKKPSKRLHTLGFYLYEVLENIKLLGQKSDQWFLRLAVGGDD